MAENVSVVLSCVYEESVPVYRSTLDMCPRSFFESKTKEASMVCVWVVAGGTIWED
jgi:hypothetical protein